MKNILITILTLLTLTVNGQEKEKGKFFKNFFNDYLKYGTIYGAGDVSNSIEASEPTYFGRKNPDGGL